MEDEFYDINYTYDFEKLSIVEESVANSSKS